MNLVALLDECKEVLPKIINDKNDIRTGIGVINSIISLVKQVNQESNMSDYASARAAGIAAVDELDLWQGQPTLSSQLASVTALQQQVAALQGQVTTLTNSNNARQTAIDNMKIQATQDQANDDARQAGAGVLAASGGF